jgi:predicted GIY-YIG superfamily endonuclease
MIGRVYRLKCGDKYYIGSTVAILNERISRHKCVAKKNPQKCHAYFNEQGWDNVIIELLEEGEFEDIKALRRREGEYILPHINDENCLNCRIAGRIKAESYKAWCDANKDKHNAQRRERYARQKNVYKFLD